MRQRDQQCPTLLSTTSTAPLGKGVPDHGPAPPPGKEPGMTEVRDAVMKRWLNFGHPRIGRPGFETCAHLGDTMLGKLTLAMRPRAPRHTKRAGHGFGAIEARYWNGVGVRWPKPYRSPICTTHSLSVSHFFISCIMRPVFDVVFEAHDFPLTLIGNKKSAKQLLPDFDKLIPFDAPNHDDSDDLFNDLSNFCAGRRRIASYTPCGGSFCINASIFGPSTPSCSLCPCLGCS